MPATNGRTMMFNDPEMEDAYINKPVIIHSLGQAELCFNLSDDEHASASFREMR